MERANDSAGYNYFGMSDAVVMLLPIMFYQQVNSNPVRNRDRHDSRRVGDRYDMCPCIDNGLDLGLELFMPSLVIYDSINIVSAAL